MIQRTRNAAIAALTALMLVGAASTAWSQSITVESTVTGGNRTLVMRSATGGTLDSISLGTSGSAAFMTNVTDVQYSRNGVQVTGTLSNLYGFDGAAFDCATSIDAANLSLDFVVSPTSLTDVAALPEPTWDLAGTLDPPLSTVLGVADGTAVTVLDVLGERIDRTLSGVFTGVENTLPIQISAGTGGAFTDPGPHATCDPTPTASTSRSLLTGNVNDLVDVYAWVTGEIEAAADLDSGGSITALELVDSGEVNEAVMAEAVREGLQDAGVNLALLDTLLNDGTLDMDDIYAVLIATLDTLSSLIGQTGTYVSLPKLVAQIPDGTQAGTYRGTLTVTMVDV